MYLKLGRLSLITLALSASSLSGQTPLCPPCGTNLTPLQGHGAAADGRRIINIWIDNSSTGWGNPLPSILHTSDNQGAVDQAISQWNDTTDAYGNKTCYYLQLTTDISNSDIGIQPVTSAPGGCGSNDHAFNYGSNTISITRQLIHTYANGPIAQLRGLIAHEIGHSLGLSNADSHCAWGSSIMTGYYKGSLCVQQTYYVQASDIAKSNQNCNNQASCDTGGSTQEDPIVPDNTCLTNNGCQQQSFYGIPGAECDPCGYPSNSGCPDYLISVQGSNGPCCTPAYSPILIDVDGKGYDLTNADHGVWFDLWGVNDGSKQQVAWTARHSTNAWLALDRDRDGLIKSGTELFGDRTVQDQSTHRNGFRALAEFDKPENGGNSDSVIDEHDAIYPRLLLWQDFNHNGISEPNELSSLRSKGILSISLTTEETKWQDRFGNKFLYRARIKRQLPSGVIVDEWVYDVILGMR